MKAIRTLIVDQEKELTELIQLNLEMKGYTVDLVQSAEQAMKKNLREYDLFLIDVALAGISGFKFTRLLKQDSYTADTPVIFVSSRNTENDIVTGLSLGAEDYIAKPFSIRELLARISVVMKRTERESLYLKQLHEVSIHYEDLEIDTARMKAFVGGKEISLTRKELEVMRLLLENRNRVLSREEIKQKVWTQKVCVLDRVIDVNIMRLRKKIGVYGKNIITRIGYGYSFEEDAIVSQQTM